MMAGVNNDDVDTNEMMNLSSGDKEDHRHETVNKNTELTDNCVGSDECSTRSFPIDGSDADQMNETGNENTEISGKYVESERNASSGIPTLQALNGSSNTRKKKVVRIIILITCVGVIAGVAYSVFESLKSKPEDYTTQPTDSGADGTSMSNHDQPPDPDVNGISMSRHDYATQPTDPVANGTSMSRQDYTSQPTGSGADGTSMSRHDDTTQPTVSGADGTYMSRQDYTTQPTDPEANGTSMSRQDEGFYNIAHMVNTPETVEWAVGQGANGVEIDLAFDNQNGNALFFRSKAEGELCDCTCLCPGLISFVCALFFSNSVCAKHLYYNWRISPCQAQSNYSTLLSTIATKSSIALVIIDSKIETESMKDDDVMRNAGRSVITVLTTHLFGRGYGGKVIVGSPTLDTLPYLQSAVNAFKGSPYEPQVYFTIYFEQDNIVKTLTILHTLSTMNIVYGTGLSASTPQQIDPSTMKLAAVNKARGVTGLTFLWTIDSNKQ